MRKQVDGVRKMICVLATVTALVALNGCGETAQSPVDYENLSREEIQEEYLVFSLARDRKSVV